MLLDEATSALDNYSEKKIINNLNKFTKNITTITIAHRTATILNAKRILFFHNGKIISGKFIVDMSTINVEDLQGGSKQRLEGHLRSDDFFSVEKFSEAIFEIKSSAVIDKDGAMQILSGNLTIKGITHPAKIEIDNNWGAKLVFDRSKYDVRFRSGNFFQNLGDKLIYDEIVISANIAFKN